MSIQCEINLHREPDHEFEPGETVSGDIKYKLSENITFRKITVSLKGKDTLTIDGTCQSNQCSNNANKNYVDINNIIHEDECGVNFAPGIYEVPFSMRLPFDIPKSLNHKKSKDGYSINYKVFYYVRIKFERAGLMKQSKSFKKPINVIASITPTLPMVPTMYEEKKKLTNFFTRKEDIVTIKATIDNSVAESGGRVQLKCEVKNDSNFNIQRVEVKLLELFQVKASDIAEEVCDVLQTVRLNPVLKRRGDSEAMKIVLDIPKAACTVRNSKLISRNYVVQLTAVLPAFYKNVVLSVPIEIGENTKDCVVVRDTPPSYWDAMNLLQHDLTDYS